VSNPFLRFFNKFPNFNPHQGLGAEVLPNHWTKNGFEKDKTEPVERSWNGRWLTA